MKGLLKITLFFSIVGVLACSSTENKNEEYRIKKLEQLEAENNEISEMLEKDVVSIKNVDHEMDEVQELKALLDREKKAEKNVDDNFLVEDLIEENDKIAMNSKIVTGEEVKVLHKPQQEMPDHRIFNDLLSKYVSSSGKVNYKGLSAEKERLKEYITELTELGIQPGYTRNEKLAYWINLYNACTLDLVLENYPLKSISDINGGKPWDLKITAVNGKSYSLNDIENDVIRPRFKEPRIHFAVNCAAVSCPRLMNSAFEADKIGSQLSKMTRSFLSNTTKNQISNSTASVSKIFDWYKEDFSDLRAFINKYSATQLDEGAEISFNEYDWSLNE